MTKLKDNASAIVFVSLIIVLLIALNVNAKNCNKKNLEQFTVSTHELVQD